MREKLPDERQGMTHHFAILTRELEEIDGYIQVGLYPDGRVGEIFVRTGKAGSTAAWLDQWAIAVSVALQNGASLENVMRKFVGSRFEPSGTSKHSSIKRCTSVLDYVARFMLATFSKETDK